MANTKQTGHLYCHITKDPGVCGGQACIDNTRVRVKNIIFLYQQGYSPEKILETYPFLNLAQVHAALSYYYENAFEIETSLAEDEAWAKSLDGSSST
jgi:uncharacterized protein (DUF433 family)